MPNMDGYEATAKLRSLGYHKPVVALTAHAMQGELQRCLLAGCDAYLTKPVKMRDLVEMISEKVNQNQRDALNN